MCAVVALSFKLNMPAIQLVNDLLTPLQLILIIPLLRLGEHLAGAPPFPVTLEAALARLSRKLALPVKRVARPTPQLEFYAEAGAPEGALYLDGKLVGFVSGVQRL